ncbi:MAG: UbiA family prenyltransferase [Candidatus Moranbacteria bacterium]|nr:UbiA family prenyltransferase [Candidatus Moranbacteria bacterium]
MKRFVFRCIESIENAPLGLGSLVVTFLALILARLMIENALALFEERSFFFLFFEFSHTFLFFLCSFLILIPIVRYAGAENIKKAINILLFGFLIILTPPIIDRWIMGTGNYWSFYEFDGLFGLLQRFFTLFGDTPDIGITYGVRVEVVLVTLALGIYAYLKSRLLKQALLVALLTYTTLFILGTFPSWVTLAVLTFQKGLLAINSNDVAALFLSPEQILGRDLIDFRSVLNFKMSLVYALLVSGLASLLLFRQYPRYFSALWHNARFPQLIYHAGLLLLGMILAWYFSNSHIRFEFFHIVAILTLLIAVESAWLASVVANDLHDTAIDAITNTGRPLIKQTIPPHLYRLFGILFFVTSLFFAALVSFSALLILLCYQALAWLYSASPLRLKKYPLVATCIAACAGILILIAGFVAVAPTHNIEALPLSLLSYLFVAYLLALPIKDFKDIAGDKHDHIYTIPVLLGATLAKQVIGSLTFLLFAISPLVLHIRPLFLPALFFGGLSFFALQKGTPIESSFFAFRKLPRIILSITLFYGLTIALFLF